jgi:hypothetical protein
MTCGSAAGHCSLLRPIKMPSTTSWDDRGDDERLVGHCARSENGLSVERTAGRDAGIVSVKPRNWRRHGSVMPRWTQRTENVCFLSNRCWHFAGPVCLLHARASGWRCQAEGRRTKRQVRRAAHSRRRRRRRLHCHFLGHYYNHIERSCSALMKYLLMVQLSWR